MSDINWNEVGSGLLSGIAAGLRGDDNTQSPAPSVQASAFDINSYLPMILLLVGGVAVAKLLKVI